MPNRLRSLLLAFAFAASGFGNAAVVALALPGDATAPQSRVASAVAKLRRPRPTRHVLKLKRPKRTLGERAARNALQAVGVPYQWGGISPSTGFDCSGLVNWAYRRAGVELPHSSYALASEGRKVGRSHMKPGDLLFFSGFGHVGLYIGHGRMVHAPHSGTRVQVVKLHSYYGSRVLTARHISRS